MLHDLCRRKASLKNKGIWCDTLLQGCNGDLEILTATYHNLPPITVLMTLNLLNFITATCTDLWLFVVLLKEAETSREPRSWEFPGQVACRKQAL